MAEDCGLVGMNNGILHAESMISAQEGGKFLIDMRNGRSGCSSLNSPVASSYSSGDFSFSQFQFLV